MDKDTKQKLIARLKAQRVEFLKKRGMIDESWRNVNEREVEFEEMATKESLVPYLDQLDELGKQQLEDIDRALGRLESDVYDICEVCGGRISGRRLEAVPWTTKCIDCAAGQDRSGRRPVVVESPEETELPVELQGLSDNEVAMAVIDAVRRDGGIDDEELRVTYEDGVLLLEGLLPNKAQHSRLQQIVYDILNFPDVEDMVKIDRNAWQRGDRTPGVEVKEETADDATEGERAGIIEAIKEGKSIAPADQIIPDEGSGRKR